MGSVRDANVETYQRIIEAFNERGFDAALAYFDDDVEFYDPDMPGGEPVRGREALAELINPLIDAWEEISVSDFDFVAAGDRVVALVETRGRGEGIRGEMEVQMRDAHTMTFRGGKVTYWRMYGDRREALSDAGLDPDRASS